MGARAVNAVRGRSERFRGGAAIVKSGSRKVLRGETAIPPIFRGYFVGGMEAGGVRGPRWIGGGGEVGVREIKGDGIWGRVEMGWGIAADKAGEVGGGMGLRIVAGCVDWDGMIIDWRRIY